MRLCSYEVRRSGGDRAAQVLGNVGAPGERPPTPAGPHGAENPRPLRARELTGFWERLAGLMAPRARLPPATVAFPRCRSVHTCAMGFPVDVAFVNDGGEVVRTVRGCRPWRLLVCREASMAVERPAREGPWLEPGDVLGAAATQGERGERP